MSTAQRSTRKPGWTAFHLTIGLLMLIGLGASAFALALLLNDDSSPTESAQVQAPTISTPTPEPTEQALLAEENEPSGNSGTATPKAAPSSTPDIAKPTAESASVTASETVEESPAATATATPTPEPTSRSVASSSDSDDGASPSSAVQENAESGSQHAAPASESTAPLARFEIPAIGVNAPVEVKSIDANGVMENPSSPDAVAWYDFTSRPKDAGNAVFAGHLDYEGVGPAVFWDLRALTSGDEVNVIQGDGNVVTYRVTSVRSVHADADASDIVALGNVAKITIITCDGSFDPSSQEYDQRIIVTGERVG